MTVSTEVFTKSILMMQKYYGHKLDDEIQSLYWRMLCVMDESVFLSTVTRILGEWTPTAQNPFPLVVVFKQFAGLTGENRTQQAIMAVQSAAGFVGAYATVSFGDLALHETIQRFGGWPAVCRWTVQDWGFKEKAFKACYESSLGSGCGPGKLMGIHELTNTDLPISDAMRKKIEYQSKQKFISWSGFDKSTMVIDHQGHGREQLLTDVGW